MFHDSRYGHVKSHKLDMYMQASQINQNRSLYSGFGTAEFHFMKLFSEIRRNSLGHKAKENCTSPT